MPEKIRLFIIAPDGQLARSVRAADSRNEFTTVRFRSYSLAVSRAAREPGVSVLVQCAVDDLGGRFFAPGDLPPCRLAFPVVFFCPELSGLTPLLGSEIRFTLLELGATTVFSKSRKLNGVLSIFRKYAASGPEKQKAWTQTIWEGLPWKSER